MGALSIARAAAEAPARIALVAAGTAITYGDLAERVRCAVGWFLRHGVKAAASERVAIVPRLDVESIVAILALMEMGVPMVLLHPRLTETERAHLVRDAAPTLVLADPANDLGDANGDPSFVSAQGSPSDDACLAIMYTSGTSGRPKGAILPRRAFLAAARGSAHNLGWLDHDRWLLCMPLAHVGGLSIVTRCLIARRCVVIPDQRHGASFDPLRIRAVLERDEVTLCSFVPTMLKRVLDEEPSAWRMPAAVRAILLGGASVPSTLLARARDEGLPVLTTYGLTEACSQVTTQRQGTSPSEEQGSGEPVLGMEVRIAAGRIEVRGASLMAGYFPVGAHDDPLVADGWLRTADYGRVDDHGRLHVLGRTSELIVTGGENVYPVEVERELERVPGVTACCVFGIPDETWGQLVCAAVVCEAKSARPSDLGFIEHFAATLAPHKRPRRIAYVDELATTPAGKLDRTATAAAAKDKLVPLRPEARRSPL